MGYDVHGSGHITFKRDLTNEEREKLEKSFLYEFELWPDGDNPNELTFWAEEKYHSDDVQDLLALAAETAPIEDGALEYVGEDYAIWRFVWKDGKWEAEPGRIEYFPIDTEKIVSAFREYVYNDLDAADHDYVKEVLHNVCGLTDDELKTLGIEI